MKTISVSIVALAESRLHLSGVLADARRINEFLQPEQDEPQCNETPYDETVVGPLAARAELEAAILAEIICRLQQQLGRIALALGVPEPEYGPVATGTTRMRSLVEALEHTDGKSIDQLRNDELRNAGIAPEQVRYPGDRLEDMLVPLGGHIPPPQNEQEAPNRAHARYRLPPR